MAKVLITYESKYGNTKRVAELINDGMNEVPGIETKLVELKQVDLSALADFDAILVGSPNHIGSATSSIKKFIDKLGTSGLGGKQIAVFDTYINRDFEKAVKGMEKQIAGKASSLKLITPGLSILVGGMKGPVAEREFPKCKEFGTKVATLLTG